MVTSVVASELVCPACGARYALPAGLTADKPQKVRCKVCAHVWVYGVARSTPPAAVAEPAAAILTLRDDPSQLLQALPPDLPAITAATPPPTRATQSQPAGVSTPPERHRALVAIEGFFANCHKYLAHTLKQLAERWSQATLAQKKLWLWIIAAHWVPVLLLTLLLGRAGIAQQIPLLASVYLALDLPLGPIGYRLNIDQVITEQVSEMGESFLDIRGQIANQASYAQQVPPLAIVAKNAAGETLASWDQAPIKQPLAAGQSAAFQLRLPAPAGSVAEIQVSFAHARADH